MARALDSILLLREALFLRLLLAGRALHWGKGAEGFTSVWRSSVSGSIVGEMSVTAVASRLASAAKWPRS